MKTLYLVRHAKSSRDDPTLADFDRPLNKRGEGDAPSMGKVLKKSGVKPDVILSSPAVRAITTARVIAEEIGYPVEHIVEDRAIYDADADDLLQIVRSIDDRADTVMMFGHNPAFTDFANALTGQQIENIPTCGFFCARFDVPSWKDIAEGKGEFESLDSPKKRKA